VVAPDDEPGLVGGLGQVGGIHVRGIEPDIVIGVIVTLWCVGVCGGGGEGGQELFWLRGSPRLCCWWEHPCTHTTRCQEGPSSTVRTPAAREKCIPWAIQPQVALLAHRE
jgi:hypothetical protein